MSGSYDWTPHLHEGECLVWQGQPSQKLYVFSWVDIYLILTVLAGFDWAFSDSAARNSILPEEIRAYFIPVSLVFFLTVMGWRRLFADHVFRSRQVYALTNKRALVANKRTATLEGAVYLLPELNVFDSGIAYRYVAFTTKGKILRWLFRGIMFDGPPELLGPNKTRDLSFLALEEADKVVMMAAEIVGKQDP